MSARVLVVDDVPPNVKLLEAKLSREYFEVITAFDGPEALLKARQVSPDIILLDVMMPGMDGFSVCQQLKDDVTTRHIPVVMVTALSDAADRVRGLEAGADDFLTKPVNDIALFARVRSLVRLKMMMDEWRARQSTCSELGVLPAASFDMGEVIDGAAVLVVEDSPIDSGKIVQTLQASGAKAIAVGTGKDALTQSQSADLDLIIVSLTMLNEDGLRLASQLRNQERTRHTPILLLTDEGDLPRIAKGLELGANDYLVRPIDRNELLARTRTQVRRKRFHERLRANYEASLSMALTDSLTGLFNRRYLDAHLGRLLSRIRDVQKPVSAILFDIDFFKKVNDTYGHAVGDEVLKEIARRVSGSVRSFDLVARTGGEEFVIVMPDATTEAAVLVAERLRQHVATTPFPVSAPGGQIDITISLGVATTENPGESPEGFIKRGDFALYDAKRSGRNCVRLDRFGDAPQAAVANG